MSQAVHNLIETDRPDNLFVEGNFPNRRECGCRIWGGIEMQLPDGSIARHFLKVAVEDGGRIMMEGEFNAMSELYKWMPNMVPKPHSWGKYRVGNPDTYFFISEFVEMSDRVPDPDQFCSKIAQLHRISNSPDGRFGFHVTTCQGCVPQSVAWEKSWPTFYSKLLEHVADLDMRLNGTWDDLAILEERLHAKVIPQLLGALEENGRMMKACLIHADLWEGNTGTTHTNGDIYIFDSGAFYAHNEMEIGDWRCHYNKIHNKIYRETYLKYYGPSEPKEEWDDRNRLYCIYYNTIYSVNHRSQGTSVRQTAYNDMYYLIEKYAPFAEGEGPKRLDESEFEKLSAERDHTLS